MISRRHFPEHRLVEYEYTAHSSLVHSLHIPVAKFHFVPSAMQVCCNYLQPWNDSMLFLWDPPMTKEKALNQVVRCMHHWFESPFIEVLKIFAPFNWWLSWSNQSYYWTIPFVHTSYTDGGGRRSFCINCKLYIHWPRVALNLHYKHVILGPRIVFVGVPGFSY